MARGYRVGEGSRSAHVSARNVCLTAFRKLTVAMALVLSSSSQHDLAKRYAQYAITVGTYGGCSTRTVEALKVEYS